ncbi:DUF4239 domain-containing protein [Aquabacter cavernae]|uniref:bestrophin-like domain n=1 Tax=Aquabacter cavernae TaxID=2496029 RepID=UPI0013DE8B45|nr:DUF4239 domain-containing protein [Aquabacter cavernae]
MTPALVSIIAFGGMFGGALAAMFIAKRLSAHHVSSSTQDTVKLGVGMVAAMTSLILGLMTASVKGNFDTTDRDVHTYALNVLSLEADLRHAGKDACPAQDLLADYTRAILAENWKDAPNLPKRRVETSSSDLLLDLDTFVRTWAPTTTVQQEVRSVALTDLRAILTTRWTVSEEAAASVPTIFVVVLIVWLALIFISFGLFAPPNGVVVACFLLCALSIGGALFLILEMSGPFDGFISISPQPLVRAIEFIEAHDCR